MHFHKSLSFRRTAMEILNCNITSMECRIIGRIQARDDWQFHSFLAMVTLGTTLQGTTNMTPAHSLTVICAGSAQMDWYTKILYQYFHCSFP